MTPDDDALWDVPLDEVPLAFLDLEMTGCDPANDRICEIAIHRVVRGAVVERLASLVDPATPVGASADIHHIDDESLRGAPTLAELGPAIERALGGAVPVGHAVSFDLAFL
nr:3'-5' exonuclease [Myxococcota bacterium]